MLSFIIRVMQRYIFSSTLTSSKLGLECYVVGGYVRDLFLERPSNDIDVVVLGVVFRLQVN